MRAWPRRAVDIMWLIIRESTPSGRVSVEGKSVMVLICPRKRCCPELKAALPFGRLNAGCHRLRKNVLVLCRSAPPPVQHHPVARRATPPHLRRGAVKNSPPDSGGVSVSRRTGWLPTVRQRWKPALHLKRGQPLASQSIRIRRVRSYNREEGGCPRIPGRGSSSNMEAHD